MFSKSLKNSVILALILLAAPIELVYTSDKDKSLTGTYSASILNTIIKIEELLKKNLNYKVIEIIKPIIKKKKLNDFEKSSLYFLQGTAQYKLKNFSNANSSFISVLSLDRIPKLLYLESLRGLSVKFLNRDQRDFILQRIKIIDEKQEDVELQLSLAEFCYQSSDFIRTIDILKLVDRKKINLTISQSEKLNELLFLAYVGNSDLHGALELIETAVISNPTKANFRHLAYIYALLNEAENHLNIWETINDNFLLDRYETTYFYKLLLKWNFHSKAEQVFIYGVKNGFFGQNDKLHNDSLNKWLKPIPTNKQE